MEKNVSTVELPEVNCNDMPLEELLRENEGVSESTSINSDDVAILVKKIPISNVLADASNIDKSIAGTSINGITINKKITPYNKTVYNNIGRIKYIVIHYVGAVSSAANNATYFHGQYVGASAHYFVDETSIWQCVEDKDASWHCGGGKQSGYGATFYKQCLNSNSIGIEMCCKIRNGEFYIEDQTVQNTLALTRYLMNQYNIDSDHVIRHFDVVGKDCPEPWVGVFGGNDADWFWFKDKLDTNDTINVNTNHYAYKFMKDLQSLGYINTNSQDDNFWGDYDSPVPKSYVVQVIDNIAGHWDSDEADKSIHWVQPAVISLCGHGIITDKSFWLNRPDAPISKAHLLAIVDKWTDGMITDYANVSYDHWGRANLNSLCDKGIITTPEAWCNDFEAQVSKGNFMALISKALKWF